MQKFKIFIDDEPFTAREETMDALERAMRAFGFTFDGETQTWLSPEDSEDTGNPVQAGGDQ